MSDFDATSFRGTPFSSTTAPLNIGSRWVTWDRHHVPEFFAGAGAELEALHEAVILQDLSPLTKYRFSGRDARAFLDHLVPRDLTRLEVGQVYYTPWCTADGQLVIENPIFRIDESTYVNTGNPMTHWFEQYADDFHVTIENVSDDFGVLPVQGPRSRDLLEAVTGTSWDDLRFSRGRRAEVLGVTVHVWRTGFTGQLGFELWIPANDAASIYSAFLEAGEPFGVQPFGHTAGGVARVEAGILMPGLDYTVAAPGARTAAYGLQDTEAICSPFELDLGRFVDFGKPSEFLGKQALLDEQARGGPPRQLVGLEVNWHDIVDLSSANGGPPDVPRRFSWTRHATTRGGERVGFASSICWSPYLRRMIGLGLLRRDVAEIGADVEIAWETEGRSGTIRANVVDRPFIDLLRRK